MEIYTKLTAVALLICAAASGCAGTVSKPVTEANKDSSFQYDGFYTATVHHRGGTQYIENWQFNCGPQDFEFQFAVKKSTIEMGANDAGDQQTGFVDKDGRFRVPIPTGKAIRASGNSDATINDGQVTLILQGKLKGEKLVGYFVQGIKQFNNNGCTYRMNFKKDK